MRPLLNEWKPRFRQHLLMRGFASETASRYTAELVPLFDFLQERGADKLSRVTRDDLDAYRHYLFTAEFRGKRIGLGRQANRLSAVKAFFGYLTAGQVLLLDPSENLKLPRTPKTLPRQLLSEEETERILLTADITTSLGIRNRAILELLYATAMRNTELRSLELNDVDLARQELFVAKGKGNKSRRLPLGEEAAAWLEDYLLNVRPLLADSISGEWVFLGPWGGKLSRGGLSLIVKELAAACGLAKSVTPHLLRHACATHMLHRGAGIRQLQVLLGHSEMSTTQRYTHIDIGDLAKALSDFHPRERGFGHAD